ncbi:MAG TPA: multidrug effflux MFS transporter [Kofleriaceae bacterium]|nr:multidrug effflux MFS transporter [Kofleriaceae bacterium]
MSLRVAIGSRRWVIALAALTGTTALSIDMSLPAQPTLVRVFGVAPEVAQLSLGMYLAGFAVGQLIVGPLSDALGRRRVLIAGLAVFTAAGAACAVAPSIGVLLAARVVQGFGSAASPVIARAMVRDTQPPAGAARMLSTIMAVLALAPMLAPMLGGALLAWFGWHAIFATLAAIGAAFAVMSLVALPETLPPERRVALSIAATAAGYARFFAAPGTRVPTLLVCLSFAGQFAFIADSPFVLIDGFGVSADHFGFYFGATALALMLGSITGRRRLARLPPARVLAAGAFTLCAGGVLAAIGVRWPALERFGLMAPVVIYFFGVGMTSPSGTAIAMQPVPEIAGTASAIIGALTMLSGGLSGFVTTHTGGSDPRTLGLVMGGAGAVAAIVLVQSRLAARPA